MFSSLTTAREYLESFIRPTVFERVKADSHLQDPLDRMRVLVRLLGDPQKKFKSVQVSGTSGKGSTAYLTANILTKAGLKTGLVTSPLLQRINERMQVNMIEIADDKLLQLVNTLVPVIESLKTLPEGEPSYFELLTALAFLYFVEEKVDIAVVEVGLEGKYDATNVLDPLVVVLTNISKDHTELLGNTEEAIASEAFSIVRKGEGGTTPVVVTGVTQVSIQKLLLEQSNKIKTTTKMLGKDFSASNRKKTDRGMKFTYSEGNSSLSDMIVTLRGDYQVTNASVALAVITSLREMGFTLPDEALYSGLRDAFFPGRFEVINATLNGRSQTFILDGAHNEAKMRAFLHALDEYYPDEERVFVIGFKKGKDIHSMTELLFQREGEFIFTKFHRSAEYLQTTSMSLDELKKTVEQLQRGHHVEFEPNVPSAINNALRRQHSIIIVTGSLYLVGEVRDFLRV